ncbi:MAG: sodium-dependent bicarbonate transport family permease [Actinobacteria bacterium]|nr:sodium-dependent bicarbonate transport family permease [Actinomycetota bacterium]
MDADVLKNLTDPAVLFFFLGVFVGLIRSNLEIPKQVAKFLSLYLLMALGFKGGQALSAAGLSGDALKVIGAALCLAIIIPAVAFLVLRRRINPFDAAAIAATYGSVSAVTFITAQQFVASRGDEAGGYLTVALVLMESPAIVMAVLLATWVRTKQPVSAPVGDRMNATVSASGAPIEQLEVIPESDRPSGSAPDAEAGGHGHGPTPIREVLREAFTDGAQLLLIGSMVIGAISGKAGGEAMYPFVNGIFKGLLAFFLLEMGLLVAKQLREVRDVSPFLIGFGLILPLINATVALTIGWALGLSVGDMTLLAVLAASGSYIVVPAVVRYAIPEASPSRYLTLALAVTFPLNMVVGIPLYYWIAGTIS